MDFPFNSLSPFRRVFSPWLLSTQRCSQRRQFRSDASFTLLKNELDPVSRPGDHQYDFPPRNLLPVLSPDGIHDL